ncbi:unnamed protein product [Pleuronectes platessa]|uniref:Uncharacterized protein n=1 Tax=Pleuronectes platessa TaxID=8262 RepID=A0A9N7VNC2_PLEPL|nr:unnamed protein product [Pleuronectes platessa]
MRGAVSVGAAEGGDRLEGTGVRRSATATLDVCRGSSSRITSATAPVRGTLRSRALRRVSNKHQQDGEEMKKESLEEEEEGVCSAWMDPAVRKDALLREGTRINLRLRIPSETSPLPGQVQIGFHTFMIECETTLTLQN